LCDVMRHYRSHFTDDTPEAVKEFNAFHTAGKNALSHMQLLLKIYNMLGEAQQAENLQSEIADVIAELGSGDV
ncbi:MAG TPA: hypothetical protein PKW15_02775, partial [Alphaproteobacteria bacterium]|nr:hypothetical protein [Alphaproteobacteria bacterium]